MSVTERKLRQLSRHTNRIEVVKGEAVTLEVKPYLGVSFVSAGYFIFTRLPSLLFPIHQERLGGCFSGATYLLEVNDNKIINARIADAAIVSIDLWEKYSRSRARTQIIPEPPILAIEIITKVDKAEYVLGKVRGFLRAGTEQVWVIYPGVAELHQFKKNAQTGFRTYIPGQVIDLDDLFPGISIAVSEIFARPQ